MKKENKIKSKNQQVVNIFQIKKNLLKIYEKKNLLKQKSEI